jgi:hypothetical protein
MRKLLFVFCMAAMIAACGESNKNRSGMNSEENAEENAGEVVTPMEEDSANMQMDTTQQQMDTIR